MNVDTGQITIRYLGGVCPVQAEGTIGKYEFYFRSRGDHWSFSVHKTDALSRDAWTYEEKYGKWPEAGWISTAQALEFIAKGIRELENALE